MGDHIIFGLQPGKYNWWPKGERPALLIRILFWWWEFILLLGDLIGFTEIYESITDFIKINTRGLNEGEMLWAEEIFGNSIPLDRVRIDQRALIGPSWGRFAYVSGFTINSWGPIRPAIFIHELTHVWQYHQVGLVYIARALWAQHSKPGYDYGGPEKIWASLQRGDLLDAYNYEQQAEIVADYFRLLQNDRPEYHYGVNAQPAMYAGMMRSINESKIV